MPIIGKNEKVLSLYNVYCIELTIKFSPLPLLVQRKEHSDAEILYKQISDSIQKGNPKLIEINCEKVEDKKIAVLVSEILAVQIYEKTSASAGGKRPGFSIQT